MNASSYGTPVFQGYLMFKGLKMSQSLMTDIAEISLGIACTLAIAVAGGRYFEQQEVNDGRYQYISTLVESAPIGAQG